MRSSTFKSSTLVGRKGLSGSVSVVSGGTSGVGKAIVRSLLEEGSCVVTFSRQASHIKTFAKEFKWFIEKNQVAVFQGDVTNELSIRRIVKQAMRRFGRIDCLVHNAGRFCFGHVEDISSANIRELFETSVLGPVLLTKAALSSLESSHGQVIVVSTMNVFTPHHAGFFYGFSRIWASLAAEFWAEAFAHKGIRVTTIFPSLTSKANAKVFDNNMILTPQLEGSDLGKLVVDLCAQPRRIHTRAIFLSASK